METLEQTLERQILEGLGDQVANFAEEWVVQTKGRWAGQALKLEKWQREFLNELFLIYDDGERVYREALLGIARKNGKSTLSAAIGLYLLMASGEMGPEVYVAAGSKDQARIVFNQAREFVDASPRLRDWLTVMKDSITCKSNHGVFRVLAADAGTNYGLNPSGVVIDELHVHEDPELYYSLTTGQLAREAPLVVSITTAGFDRDSICYSLYERGRELMETGGIEAMRKAAFLFKWYEAPATATVQDMDGWQAANPSSWIRAVDLKRESERLPESVFRRLHLNQWTEAEDAWIKPHQWDACKGTPIFDPNKPLECIAVDVGVRRDSSAFVWGQWHQDTLHIGQEIMLPEDEGDTFGVADIRARLAQRYRSHTAKEVGYDPWSFRESAEILAEMGIPMVEFPQNNSRMAPASEQLYELVTERRLVHDGNREMRRQVLAAVVQPTDRGGWRISKRKSLERIDAAMALAMTADRATTLRHERPQRRGAAFF
jgi:phage terminase large subunit-like protein